MNNNNEFMFRRFIEIEKRYINDAKWYEGLKINKDPGNDYVNNWITKNASWFRDQWNESDCKNCKKVFNCGTKLIKRCETFEKE